MKHIQITTTFFLLIMHINISLAQSKNTGYRYSTISFPISQNLTTSFYVNDSNQVFLPLNGGIYLPKDSVWFMPPAKDYYFTSFAPDLKDTALFVIANSAVHTELFYLKSSLSSPIKRYPAVTLDKGLFNIINKNGVCYLWGYQSGTSKIGILVEDEIKWLLIIEGLIKQVQVDDSSEIYFAHKNSIYKLSSRQNILTLDKPIYGFAFDKNGRMILSCADGIGIQNKGEIEIIATGVAGPVEYKNNRIFVLDMSRQQIVQIGQE